MDDHGEQPGPTPGRGAGRSENLQGGSMWMITWMAMVSSRDRPREGARGAQRTYRGGPEEGCRGDPAFLAADETCITRVEVDTGGAPLVRCAAHTPDRVPIV